MADQTKTEECIAPGIKHDMQLVVAAHGAQTFKCANNCGHYEDVIEDSQP